MRKNVIYIFRLLYVLKMTKCKNIYDKNKCFHVISRKLPFRHISLKVWINKLLNLISDQENYFSS